MELPEPILLDRYLKAGDHAAFTELVRRHLPLVHAASLRVTRNASQAEEAAQLVFTRLAGLRSAPLVPLVVWLHRTTRSASLNLIRAESRRRKWESLAAASASAMPASSSPWERISPVLDEVIDELPRDDRHLVLARFIQGESHAALARTLGLSEDAARMRVNRALEKLRGRLAKRGITTTATALGLALPAHAASTLAPALFLSVSQTALASAAAATATLSLSTFTLILMTKKSALIAAAAALLLIGAGTVALQSPSAPPSLAGDTPRPARPAAGADPLLRGAGLPALAGDAPGSRKASVRPENSGTRGEIFQEIIQKTGIQGDITAETIMAKENEFNDARIEQRLVSLTRALNLTPPQNQELRKILGDLVLDPETSDITAKTVASENVTVSYSIPGRPGSQPLFSLAEDSPALDKLRGQLSDPQQQALDQLRQQEREQSVRLKAQSELLEMQRLIALEPGQEQRLSEVLATQYEPDQPQDEDSRNARTEAKDAALRGILSAEQMNVYQKSRERMAPTVATMFYTAPPSGNDGR